MNFVNHIIDRTDTINSNICVGLDPYPEKFPASLGSTNQAVFKFNKAIIDATHDLVCCYKPQFAHFAAIDALDELKQTIAYIKANYPEVPVILDSKRGDIGSTAAMYAKEAFEIYGADAVTVNPYMGIDTVEPFARHTDKGVIILCRTSNPGAAELQNQLVSANEPLYERVAKLAANDWNQNRNTLLVVGATAPDEMARIRQIAPDTLFLVPGIGAQGGDFKAVMNAGLNEKKQGLIINSSRGVLYASQGEDFAAAARAATLDLVSQYREIMASL